MDSVEYFRNPSPMHVVREEAGGFSIHPFDASEEARLAFQPVALRAEHYVGSDFTPKTHYDSDHGGIDEVYFRPLRK